MIRNTVSVAKRIFRNLWNDKHTLALMLLAPAFAMLIFGLALSGEVSGVRVVVVNQDQGAQLNESGSPLRLSDFIVDELDRNTVTPSFSDNEAAAVREVEQGKAYGVIIFPQFFTRDVLAKAQNLSAPGDTVIRLRLDKSNITVATAITQDVVDAVFRVSERFGQEAPVSLDTEQAIYGQNARALDFFVPGILVLVVFLLASQLTLLAFVGERTSGTLNRLLASPVKHSAIVAGYAVSFSVIAAVQSAILLILGVLAFNVTIAGNVMLTFLVIVLLALVSLSIGILLSARARDETQAIQMFPFVVMPTFLLAGVFWPLEAIPSWLRPLSYLVPPTYAVRASRSVMTRGWGVSQIWIDLLALLGLAIVFLGGAVWSVRRHRA